MKRLLAAVLLISACAPLSDVEDIDSDGNEVVVEEVEVISDDAPAEAAPAPAANEAAPDEPTANVELQDVADAPALSLLESTCEPDDQFHSGCPDVPGFATWCYDRHTAGLPVDIYGRCTMLCDQPKPFWGPQPAAKAACEALGGQCVKVDEGKVRFTGAESAEWIAQFPPGAVDIERWYCVSAP